MIPRLFRDLLSLGWLIIRCFDLLLYKYLISFRAVLFITAEMLRSCFVDPETILISKLTLNSRENVFVSLELSPNKKKKPFSCTVSIERVPRQYRKSMAFVQGFKFDTKTH